MLRPLRSLLFAPGAHPRRVEKALGLEADAVILDLEDSVAITAKAAAREAVAAALERPRAAACYVRINAWDTPWAHADLCAVVRPGLDGILLPKVEAPHQLLGVDWVIGQLEGERDLAAGSIDLIALIETARGLAALEAIAGCGSRARRLAFGAADFCLDTGMRWSEGESELAPARQRVVVASRAAGLEAPIDTPWLHIADQGGLERSAARARDLGFAGKLCIHPAQLEPVNAVFTPSPEEIEQARRQLEAFERAEAAGSAAIEVDGALVDYPVAERARRIVALAGKHRQR